MLFLHKQAEETYQHDRCPLTDRKTEREIYPVPLAEPKRAEFKPSDLKSET